MNNKIVYAFFYTLHVSIVKEIYSINYMCIIFFPFRHFLKDNLSKDKKAGYITLSSAAFHRKTHLMVVGFSNGSFFLYEMPNCYQIHSLS